jgi:OmpA-OmpF porin, OOP family
MRKSVLLGAGITLAVALSSADAGAQLFRMPSGPGAWYIGGEGGWTHLESPQTGRATIAGVGGSFSQSFDNGFNVGLRSGYELGPWRLEEEFSFRQHGITRACFVGVCAATNGNRNTYAFMTNLLYDFNIGWAITPHIGGGIGAVLLRDGWGIPGVGTAAGDSQWVLGWQGIAGIRYNINPSLAFDLDYRYLGTEDPTFRFGGGAAASTIPTTVGSSYTSGYSTHSVLASLSVRFGAPPPPVVARPAPPPPPPPVTRKVFLVFFDWDKATITPEGMAILQQAAAAWRSGAPVTIQVTGYADRSGSPGYNQRLSERRANNVAGAMVGLGVPRQAMAVSGRGENDNRVPTADGVREPQNRRVEIVFP